jgi:hydrogenase maturation protease
VSGDVIVLCLGNVLAGDDGIGVHIARALLGEDLAGARVVDGGTLGIELLPVIADAGALILVDAVELGMPAGTVRTIEGDALHAAVSQHLSAHQVGVADLLALGRLTGALPDRVVLVGVQPARLVVSTELSEAAGSAMPAALQAVRDAAAALAA